MRRMCAISTQIGPERTYDHDMKEVLSMAPENVVSVLADYIPVEARASVRILDVAAGTGRVGRELVKPGFKNIDAVDYSQPMLDVLAKLNIYDQKVCAQLGHGRTIPGVAKALYDVVFISGGFAQAHLPIECIEEVARVLKPGGLFLNHMSRVYLESVDSLGGLEPLMRQMEANGVWLMRARLVRDNIIGGLQGLFHVFEKP